VYLGNPFFAPTITRHISSLGQLLGSENFFSPDRETTAPNNPLRRITRCKEPMVETSTICIDEPRSHATTFKKLSGLTEFLIRHDRLIGCVLWLTLIAAIIVIEAAGNLKSVTPAYTSGARNWLNGEDLYDGTGGGFIYLPLSALLYTPMVFAGEGPTAEIIWRVATIGSFAAALFFCSRMIESQIQIPCFATMSGMGCILSFPAARNGQATLPMVALLVMAISTSVQEKYLRAGIASTLAILIKPLALPVIAVLAIIRPRLIPLVGLGCLAVVLLPFLLAETLWVHRQNAGFIEVLQISREMQGSEAWATFFGLFNLLGSPVPRTTRLIVQAIAAFAVVIGCRTALKRLAPGIATLHIYTLTFTLLLLFSPRTENNTYACIVPSLVMVMACSACSTSNKWLPVAAGWLGLCGLIGSYEIGRLLLPETRGVWLAPLTTILLTPWFVSKLVADLKLSSNFATDNSHQVLSIASAPPEPLKKAA
jgi:alpha-1,2-mannosyltransferase